MITLTRLNGSAFVLNAELIRTIEQNPDTTITLVGGEHLVVREGVREVVARVIEYGRLLRRALPASDADPSVAQDSPRIWSGAGAEAFTDPPARAR